MKNAILDICFVKVVKAAKKNELVPYLLLGSCLAFILLITITPFF